MTELSKRIKAERQGASLSQAALAARAGLDQSYVSRLERGEKSPGAEVLRALAQALEIPLSRLLGETVPGASGPVGAGANQRAALLAETGAPRGLAELAADETLVVTLGITPEEWRALWSIRLPGEATKAGHVQLLYTIRAVSRPAGSVTES